MKVPPRKILLATDLSARSDRAQDRAVSLMKSYNSDLLVLHVLEPTRIDRTAHRVRFLPYFHPDKKLIEKAKWQLLDGMGDAGNRVKLWIEKGDPHREILRVAEDEHCDLIISGVARNEMLGRLTLGKTVDRLVQDSEIPVLIVSERVRAPYRNIVVTSDFSDVSRQALATAAAYFPTQELRVFYAHSTPGSWAVDDLESYKEVMRQTAYQEYRAFLDAVDWPDEKRPQISVLIEWGDPARLLQDLVQGTAVDLVVMGSRVRNVLRNFFSGSVAKRIVLALQCDVLVVRGHHS